MTPNTRLVSAALNGARSEVATWAKVVQDSGARVE